MVIGFVTLLITCSSLSLFLQNARPPSSDTPSNAHRYDDSQRYSSRSGGVSASRPTKLADLKTSSFASLSSVDTVQYESMEVANTRQSSSFDDGHPSIKPDPDASQPGRVSDDLPPPVPASGTDNKDDPRSARDSGWKYRNGPDDGTSRMRNRPPFNGRFGNGNDSGSRFALRDQRSYDRDTYRDRDRDTYRERDRERDYDHDKDRDWDHDKDRDRRVAGDLNNRFRDDRRLDDRSRGQVNRRPFAEHRPYDSRSYDAPRRYDSKPSNDLTAAAVTKPGQSDERNAPDTSAPRPLGEERSISRLPLDNGSITTNEERRPGALPLLDDRPLRPPPADDRQGPIPSTNDRLSRYDDRRPPGRSTSPVLADRPVRAGETTQFNFTLGMRPAVTDGIARHVESDRRPQPPSSTQPDLGADRSMRTTDERRRSSPVPVTNERQNRLDRRPLPPSGSTSVTDRQVRPIDDRHPPVEGDRQSKPSVIDDRPPPTAPSAERQVRQPGASNDRRARGPPAVPDDRGGPRIPPSSDHRTQNPPNEDDKTVRPSVPLEDRIGRPTPMLQDRLSTASSTGSSKPEDRPGNLSQPSRTEPRLGRTGSLGTTPVLANEYPREANHPGGQRLSHPPDKRPAPSDERESRQHVPGVSPAVDRVGRPAEDHAAAAATTVPPPPPPLATADSSRPPTFSGARPPRPDDRGRPPDRFAPPEDRPPPPAAPSLQGGPPPRASSIAREDSRGGWKASSPQRFSSPPSPVRPRSFLSAAEIRRDGANPQSPSSLDRARYADRRSDMMEVDPPSGRYSGAPRRSSPAPDGYYSRGADASWTRNFPEDPARHMSLDPPYRRGWTSNDRALDDWSLKRPAWDAAPRDGPLVESNTISNHGWETREAHERRVAIPDSSSHTTATRPFERRPPLPHLPENYPSEDRGYQPDRPRYTPMDVAPTAPYSRGRPRTPSPRPPGRRVPGTDDDLRPPPVKRPRDDDYDYYPSAPSGEALFTSLSEYMVPSRPRTPPPPNNGSYYDGARPAPYTLNPATSGSRDRPYDPPPRNDVGGYHRYDRRPPPRSPPHYSRGYDRRYSMPPQ